MNKLFFILLFLSGMSIAFTSCNLQGESEATPDFRCYAFLVNEGDTTLLNFSQGNVLDSIAVGDTVTFLTSFSSLYNKLLEYNITSSRKKSVDFIWPAKENLESIFTTGSDYDNGKFAMPGTYQVLSFPFKYVVKEEEENLKLTFSGTTDGSEKYNSFSVTIITPTKKTKDTEEGEE
ncbi:hypothetical protein D0T49_01155 [Paludibacter sp. 221]|uniref:hypothetical protein n=1 Tax=Paludibacter sp. 221 TaxID=2302939 RepID=UPI0013D4298A|nr:hypothetical protein [Paludibacter sp. 221]NDV45658.1 hypothetical protein [Paludibacter sp. 221]